MTRKEKTKVGSRRAAIRTSGPIGLDQLYVRPGFLLRRAQQIAVGIFVRECAPFGLTPPQHSTLIVIGQRPSLDQAAVARAIGFDRATVGQVLEGLEVRGLVKRESSPSDRRRKTLVLTPRGRALMKRAAPAIRRTSDRLLGPLPARDRDRFVQLLLRLTNALNKASRTPVQRPQES